MKKTKISENVTKYKGTDTFIDMMYGVVMVIVAIFGILWMLSLAFGK